MEAAGLSENLTSFDQWKSQLIKELKSYRLWMRRNQVFTNEADKRLYQMLETLHSDYLTIAFVGEFSRGKTELINAIFFGESGRRMLPSQAGRTTMCPTEIFYDRDAKHAYLRLLPIETRLQDMSIQEYKKDPKHWVDIELPSESNDKMVRALENITETKKIALADALALGFDRQTLAKNLGENQMVEIPVWRHALISYPHPLLQKGLAILDTPGLNALGNEPELTINMIPSAQAVVFILAADAGVSASDLEMWEKHVKQLNNRPNVGLYAVLNKIDVLWDELKTPEEIRANIDAVREETSRHLDIPTQAVVPVSAQKALTGKVKEDADLVERSNLESLEKLLSVSILENKHNLLWETVVEDAKSLVTENNKVLMNQRNQLVTQRNELEALQNVSKDHVKGLVAKTETTRAALNRAMVTLKPSQRLMEKQMHIMLRTCSNEKIEKRILETKKELIESKTTVGIMRSMKEFFAHIDSMMIEFCHEAELSNKMAESIYNKFQETHELVLLEPRLLPAKKFRRDIEQIFSDAEQFNQAFLLTVSQKSVAIRRFFSTTVAKIMQFFQRMRKECTLWSESITNPLLYQIKSHKELLDQHLHDLATLQTSSADSKGRLNALNTLLREIDAELEHAQNLLGLLSRPNTLLPRDNNVVDFRSRR
ncbi:MAG: dynamin family protein [Pseudomonadota bacterium]